MEMTVKGAPGHCFTGFCEVLESIPSACIHFVDELGEIPCRSLLNAL